MTVEQIFDLAIKLGIQSDLRGEAAVKKNLKKLKERFDKMSAKEKEFFDEELLNNPYPDSRILHLADGKKKIKKVMVGIDMESAELLLAKQLGDIDLVIAHHPEGKGLSAGLHEVMKLQAEVLHGYGVPINVAEKIMEPRIGEVARGVSASNHFRAVDIARLLNMNYICVHTPCDNLVANFLKKNIQDKNKDMEYVEDVMEALNKIEEYKEATKRGYGPSQFAGSRKNYCGRIALTEITGGTEGSPEIYERLSQAGIGTIIGMHMSEKHTEAARKAHVNAIIAGHISSDSLGLNLFLDELEKNGVEVVPCSGLIRVPRLQESKKARKQENKKA